MIILGIDCSGSGCSAALSKAGTVLADWEQSDQRASEELGLGICGLLQTNNIRPEEVSRVVVALGPGSYTGLRIGISAALGFGAGAGVDVFGVPALAARLCMLNLGAGTYRARVSANANEDYIAEYEISATGKVNETRALQLEPKQDHTMDGSGNRVVSVEMQPRDGARGLSLLTPEMLERIPHRVLKGTEQVQPLYGRGVNAKTIAERRMHNTV